MLFADLALARRIEHAECRLTVDVAESFRAHRGRPVLVATLRGGTVLHIGEESPFNKMIGVGLNGALEEAGRATLAAVAREHDARGAALQAEVATLADGSVLRDPVGQGFALVGFENVLGRCMNADLDDDAGDGGTAELVEVVRCGEADVSRWIDVVGEGFARPDTVPAGAPHESFSREAVEGSMREMAGAPGFACYLATVDGTIAGGAALRLCEGVAQFCGSAALPSLRRRGVQTALFRQRLADAQRAGSTSRWLRRSPGRGRSRTRSDGASRCCTRARFSCAHRPSRQTDACSRADARSCGKRR